MHVDANGSEYTCAWERVFGVRLRDVPAAVWSRFLVRRPVMETRSTCAPPWSPVAPLRLWPRGAPPNETTKRPDSPDPLVRRVRT